MEWMLAVPFVAGIVAMDTTSGPQLMVSEPFVSCSIVGLFFGQPEAGLLLGIFFQLIHLGHKPLGAVRFYDGNMAAVIAAGSLFGGAHAFGMDAVDMRASMIPVIVYSVLVAVVGRKLTTWVRQLNSSRSDRMYEMMKSDPHEVYGWHVTGICISFCRGFVMAFILVPPGMLAAGLIVLAPGAVRTVLAANVPVLWGLVFAVAAMPYWNKGKRRFLATGFLGGAAWTIASILVAG